MVIVYGLAICQNIYKVGFTYNEAFLPPFTDITVGHKLHYVHLVAMSWVSLFQRTAMPISLILVSENDSLGET